MKLSLIHTFIYSIIFLILSTGFTAQVVINEFQSDNFSKIIDSTYGAYSDWIELFNPTNEKINLSGYYLTDEIKNKTKWIFPIGSIIEENSYLVIWADKNNNKLHTSFTLDNKQEHILLFSTKNKLIDSLSYSDQIINCSYGRLSDGSNFFGYFTNPTPGKSNSSLSFKKNSQSPKPRFSNRSGIYNSKQTIKIKSKNKPNIRYTLDGSDPTEKSMLYNRPLKFDSTVCIKARTFKDGVIPSNTITNSYLINVPHQLPIVSISTDHKNLFDESIGIYFNYAKRWERPIEIEYFEDKKLIFKSSAGIKIMGAYIRGCPQKAFSIQLKKRYNSDLIDHPFFNDKDYSVFKSFILRNSGNDMSKSFIRDGLMQSLLVDQMDIDYQSYKPVTLYINGKFWGLYNLREKQNKHYLASNHKVDINKIDLIENNKIVIYGNDVEYLKLTKYIDSSDKNSPYFLQGLNGMMDVNEYTNYLLSQIYFDNADWPGLNIKCWRPQKEMGIFRWLLFDVDFGFDGWLNVSYSAPTLDCFNHLGPKQQKSPCWANDSSSTKMIRQLLQNTEFKNEFIQRLAVNLNTTFKAERVLHFIDSLKSNIEHIIPDQIERWHAIDSLESWNLEIKKLENFAINRPSFLFQYINDFFSLYGTNEVNFNVNDRSMGEIQIHQHKITLNNFSLKLFKSIPIKVTAISKGNYEFSRWEGIEEHQKYSQSISFTADSAVTSITAIFRKKE
tara:strand:- start:281 stop:2458 length:2178 start_codon:yes stop_codon:yes gene_type:complete